MTLRTAVCGQPRRRGFMLAPMTAVNQPNPASASLPESTESALTTPQLSTSTSPPPKQRHNPLHGVTLEAMVVALADYFGWDELGQRIPVRCFQSDPSVGSSLKFLRKTPWAREKVESLYLFVLRDQKRNAQE